VNTQDDLRLLAWHSSLRSAAAVDVYRRLTTEGKLLQRIELLPRGFTAPTIEYFDLDASAARHVFPPPDDIEPFRDRAVFLDRDAVPSRVGAGFDHQPITLILVSRARLGHLDLALTGVGRAVVRQGPLTVRPSLDPVHPTFVRLTPWRTWPWFKYFYSLELSDPTGYAYARILQTPCNAAELQLGEQLWETAVASLRRCQGTRYVEPARLFDLAWAEARRGRRQEAVRALEDLERASPSLLAGFAKLAAQPDGDAWRERYRQLAGQDRGFWWRRTHSLSAAESGKQPGDVVVEEAVGRLLRVRRGQPAEVKLWLPPTFLRGRYVVAFSLRGRASGPGPLASLSVAQLSQGRTLKDPAMVRIRSLVPVAQTLAVAPVATPAALSPGAKAQSPKRGGTLVLACQGEASGRRL